MIEEKIFSIPKDLQALNSVGNTYHFTMDTGEVVGEPTSTDHSINFFLQTDTGKENDLTLQTSIKARPGHRASVLYVSKSEDELAHAVAWVNHTTGKADYLKPAVREVVGDKIAIFFLTAAEAMTNALGNLTDRHSGAITILILPIIIGVFTFSLLLGIIGSIFSLKSGKVVSSILRRAEKIIESFDPAYAAWSKKPFNFKKLLTWIGIIILIFFALVIWGLHNK